MADMKDPLGAPDDGGDVGQRIKAMRKHRALTLIQLSERCGVSRAALSKIERKEISPTYATLRKICMGLDVTIAALFADEATPRQTEVEVVRASAAPPFAEADAAYALLAGQGLHGTVRCFTSDVNDSNPPRGHDFHTHDTEDIVYVLEGSILCHFEGRAPIKLHRGDSLSYRGDVPHTFTGVGTSGKKASSPARALWVSVRRS